MNIDNFVTPLGTVELNIEFKTSPSINLLSTESGKQIQTPNLRIEIFPFNDVSTWTDELAFPVDETKGWIIRIYQQTDISEQLEIACELKTEDTGVDWSWDADERLSAIVIENATHFLNIGTEDGEVLRWRSERDDYLPPRFEKELGWHSEKETFLAESNLGLKIIVPGLRKGERFYFHFLAAVDCWKRTVDSPDGNSLATHYAVDFPKHILIKRLNIPEQKLPMQEEEFRLLLLSATEKSNDLHWTTSIMNCLPQMFITFNSTFHTMILRLPSLIFIPGMMEN